MGTGNLHHTVDQSWPPYHLLRQREQRPDLIGGSEEIGVVRGDDNGHRLGNERPLFQRRENSAKHGYGNFLSIPVLTHCCPIFGFH